MRPWSFAAGVVLVLVVGCGASPSAPPPTAPTALARVELTITSGSSGTERDTWDAAPTSLRRTAYRRDAAPAPVEVALDAAGWAAIQTAVTARHLGAVAAEPDACGGGTAHRLVLTYADGATVTGWRHCGKGSLVGDIDGFVQDLDARLPPAP